MKYVAILSFTAAVLVVPSLAFGGYTHYYTWKQPPDERALKACIAEMAQILAAAKTLVAGPDGVGQPKVDSLHIEFNGVGDDAHEPFVFPAGVGFNFCKTFAKPYDAVVTACLIVARDHFPPSVLSIDSDGQWSEGDWNDGAQLYQAVTGRAARNPIDDTDGPMPNGPPPNDTDWIGKAILIGLVIFALWWFIQPHWEFSIFVADNKIDRVRGQAARPFLLEVDDVCREFCIPSGTIRALRTRYRVRLVFSRSIPAECRQRIRNVWAADLWRRRLGSH